jgi:hypothetical protein
MSKLTPSRISQQDASRILFAHAKAVKATRNDVVLTDSRTRLRLKDAEAAFEALVAGMVQDEVE